jgi:hypothetical protein
MSIYGEPVPHESWRKLKHMGRAANVMNSATSEYL